MKAAYILPIGAILVTNTLFLGAAKYQKRAPQLVAPVPDVPLHEQTIEILKRSESVIPPNLDAHPVVTVYNREAIVPPQCYTQTEGTHNPCYVCHQSSIPGRENRMEDFDLQIDYSFSDLGTLNHWKNLFEDRTARVASISDEKILDYVNSENYSELAGRLQEAGFEGWIPDLKNLHEGADAFDENGFAKDGSDWVAFNYKPFPSTFWPTNGSTDDVMIRLPDRFRTTEDGTYSIDVYKANLAILEANMKGKPEIACLPVDEEAIGKDLDGNGALGTANRIVEVSSFVGSGQWDKIDTHLYPEGTEFLHTVRYLGLGTNDEIQPSPRIKEVRYMKKWKSYAKGLYARKYQLEAFEKEVGNLPGYHNLGEWGLDNGNGWALHSFIEDKQGRLRANTFEENLFCMGCHNSIGSTVDKTFSFARKVDGPAGWGYIDLRGMPDAPNEGEIAGEILTYLERVGGGSEFRNNDEMFERWFNEDGSVNREKVMNAKDVYELITPSRERALALNKAYKTIVEDQDYIYGRDPNLTPPQNVYDAINNEETPTLPNDRTYTWNIMLDWSKAAQSGSTLSLNESTTEKANP
ncbi:hypothetical protein QEH56_07505 [Pelagicoccus enzymogenes]|uniref:hypothetical protein n=1 Tax=Pelagicoccus enzymogenes TaxID=2773457 RepID=UPI00280DC1D4|nr:hypothetical protein [Pelagicoccus enzymogenes]MDQ8197988.1 hypothetical protein [Pelagicoccus enzymogenes]